MFAIPVSHFVWDFQECEFGVPLLDSWTACAFCRVIQVFFWWTGVLMSAGPLGPTNVDQRKTTMG